jgi:hypothetical protein
MVKLIQKLQANDGYWAYENWVASGHHVRIHRAHCGFCNHGTGIFGGGTTPNGRWHGPFRTLEEAREVGMRPGVEIFGCLRCMQHTTER